MAGMRVGKGVDVMRIVPLVTGRDLQHPWRETDVRLMREGSCEERHCRMRRMDVYNK